MIIQNGHIRPSAPFEQLPFTDVPDFDGLQVFILEIDQSRQIADVLVRFLPDRGQARHVYRMLTNTLMLEGELRVHDAESSEEEIRTAGGYYGGAVGLTQLESAGPAGAILYYSIRGAGGDSVMERLGENDEPIAELKWTQLTKMFEIQIKA